MIECPQCEGRSALLMAMRKTNKEVAHENYKLREELHEARAAMHAAQSELESLKLDIHRAYIAMRNAREQAWIRMRAMNKGLGFLE